MGWKLKRVDVKLAENEEKDLCVVLQPEKKSCHSWRCKISRWHACKECCCEIVSKKGL